MRMRLTYDRIKEMAEEAGYEFRSYSGRGMFGKQCASVVSDESMMRTLAALVECCSDTEEAAELLRAMRDDNMGRGDDNMGRGIVLYWPRVRLLDDAA